MNKYKFTYFLNTACAERRPQTRRDLQEDWIVEEKEYPTALEAFEHAYIEILDNDEEDLQDLYEENGIGPDDEVKKLEALKNDFDCIDPGDGSTILISIEGEGPVDSYDSGYDQESFNDDYVEDDEDYDDEEYLDENKKLNEEKDYEEEVEDFIQQCRDSGQFNFRQMDEIRMGFYYGNNLPIEKVKIYAKPEFSEANMSTIRAGIEDGLSDEKIQFLANPDLAYFQRYQVLRGFRFGLSVEQVKTYAYLDDDAEMKERINELVKEKDKKLNETIDLKPDGGDKKNWFAFYTGQSDFYKNNTENNIAQFGKENLEGLKDLSIDEIKNSHIYWGTELAGFHSMYNGDTYILFDDIEKLPEDMKQDAYENCKGIKKVNEEKEGQLEIDEKGLPVLEKPYIIEYRNNDDRYQITSSHPYDLTDYSWAISLTNDINDEWKVIDPGSNNKQIVKGWNEALDLMKKIDSEKKSNIDRT